MRLLLLAAAGMALHAVPMTILNPSFELGAGQFGDDWYGTCGSCGVFVDSGFDFLPGEVHLTRTMYVNSTVGVHQIIGAVAADMIYTINVMIGDRLNVPFAGSDIRLYSSPSFTTFAAATLLAQVVNPVTPAEGQFAMGTLVYTTGAAPADLGHQLILRLGGATAGSLQTHFDLVTADATPTPEPAAWVMVGGAGLVLRLARRQFGAKSPRQSV